MNEEIAAKKQLLDNDLKELLKEKMKRQMIEVIPDEMWDSMIKQILEEFKENDIQKIVKNFAKERLIREISDFLNGAEWQKQYGIDGREKAGKAVIDLIKEISPDMIASMFGGLVQAMLEGARNHISSGTNYQNYQF